MPELPEVETIKRDLEQKIVGLRIDGIKVFDKRVIQNKNINVYKKYLVGANIERIIRRGKALIITFDNHWHLFVQVKMTGHLVYGKCLRQHNETTETKVVFKLSNGKFLNYNDHRTFGWLYLVDNLNKISYLNNIGPEPLGDVFSSKWLMQALLKRKSSIKTIMMNQHFVAGIGNIYASEILFAARVNPQKKANCLSNREVSLLYSATQEILKEAIECRGTSMRNYRDTNGEKGIYWNRIKVYGRQDEQCFRCRKTIVRIVQAGRSTFYCTHCQKI
ncbi:MAG: bifunctional DNA-formamidopyrimidine glycosylase/DNA-(apurinic or apyrimidinic site) lyase [Candidatus Omnitrophica bacterium]|nr:bifunctional DNA-formamidopyrimidine glycosylase/DNA-(apurinic or apyrimidinic site) lyase [Candidatus Omnitrophota bacterium]